MSNVDLTEVAKFSTLASDWWNPYGHSKPLHDINPLRLSFIEQHTSLENKQILDVGCGGGILTESLAMAGAQVTGIDCSEEAINVAIAHAKQQDLVIDYQLSAIEELALVTSKKFDIITCMELLEHVPDPASIIKTCATLLKSDGQLFLSTLNRNFKSYLFAIVGAEYFLKLLPKGTHQYEKFIRPTEIFKLLQDSELHLAHMTGIHYHPIFKRYSLAQDISVNYLVHATYK